MTLATALLFGLWALALALFVGLVDIASAIRNRTVDVNLKLPPIQLQHQERGDE